MNDQRYETPDLDIFDDLEAWLKERGWYLTAWEPVVMTAPRRATDPMTFETIGSCRTNIEFEATLRMVGFARRKAR